MYRQAVCDVKCILPGSRAPFIPGAQTRDMLGNGGTLSGEQVSGGEAHCRGRGILPGGQVIPEKTLFLKMFLDYALRINAGAFWRGLVII